MSQKIRIDRVRLEQFCTDVFIKLGLPQDEAQDSAEILVAADARGIESHGVGRLWRYKNGLQKGIMKGGILPTTLQETPISLVLDANGAMGLSLSKRTMAKTIEKARVAGAAFSSVRNSNHFGIAGFYSEMAAREDMIGIGMTNTAALGVPTFGRKAMFGTNPIAFSIPAHDGRIFTLDMATTVVTRGKIEVYDRENKPLPSGWAVDTRGKGTSDAHRLLEDMLYQRGGGLLPLGGEGELLSGYKGYGLAEVVDILTAILSGGVFGQAVIDSQATSARVCHFFGALRLDLFRDAEAIKSDMDRLLTDLEMAEPAEGCERVYYAGLKEHEAEAESAHFGVPISEKVALQLKQIGEELGVEPPIIS
ncbi:MAG TPA: Ldh family oxidoreductase [Rectinema sp.]|nr:Ldh family oxidoreductase [Rectinema sp.]